MSLERFWDLSGAIIIHYSTILKARVEMLSSLASWMASLPKKYGPRASPEFDTTIPFLTKLPSNIQSVIESTEPLYKGFDGHVWNLGPGLVYKQSTEESADSILREMLAYSLLVYVVRRFRCLQKLGSFCEVLSFYIPQEVLRAMPELATYLTSPATLFKKLNPRVTSAHDNVPLSELLELIRPGNARERSNVRAVVEEANYLIANVRDVDPNVFSLEQRADDSDSICNHRVGIVMKAYQCGLDNFVGSFSASDSITTVPLSETTNLASVMFENLVLLRIIHGAHLDFKWSNIFVEPADGPVTDLNLSTCPDLKSAKFVLGDFTRFIFVPPYENDLPPTCPTGEFIPMETDQIRGNVLYGSRALLMDATPAFTDDFESLILLLMSLPSRRMFYEPVREKDATGRTVNILPLRRNIKFTFADMLRDMMMLRNNADVFKFWLKSYGTRDDVASALCAPLGSHRQELEELFDNMIDEYLAHGAVSFAQPGSKETTPAVVQENVDVADSVSFSSDSVSSDSSSSFSSSSSSSVSSRNVSQNVRRTRGRRPAAPRYQSLKISRKYREEIVGLPRRNKTETRRDSSEDDTPITVLRKFNSYRGWNPVTAPYVGYLPAAGVTKRQRKQTVFYNI